MNKNGYFHPETENYKFWTQQEDEFLIKMAREGKGYKEIAKILNRSYISVMSRGGLIGANSTYKPTKKYTVDENFWEIPNKINSYYAGFSSADASIMCFNSKTKLNGGYCIYRLEISNNDFIHIEKFKNLIHFTGPTKIQSRNKIIKSHGNYRKITTVSISICSKKWAEDLNKNFNITPQKTNILSIPNIDLKFIWCWLVGYIDGDGTIFIDKNNKRFRINFVSSSEIIIKSISLLIKKYFKDSCERLHGKGINGPPKGYCEYKKLNHSNAYFLSIAGTRAAVLFDYLSQIQGLPRLDRKWNQENVLKFVNDKKLKFPHLFKTFEYNDELNNLQNPIIQPLTHSSNLSELNLISDQKSI